MFRFTFVFVFMFMFMFDVARALSASPRGPDQARATPTYAQSAKTTWDGVYTEAQATRGAAAYARVCAQCHGPALTGAEGPPLTGVEFTSNWNGLSLGELFERVRTSMPPDDPSRLSAAEKIDVLAHVLAVGKFPTGPSELSRDALPQIRFQASRP